MTGFESKRQAAQAKVRDEMQVIFTQRQAERDKLQDEPDMLLIVYQRGFADGKAAQRKWVGLEAEEILDLFDINNVYGSKWIEFARTVEAKLKAKNGH